MSREGTSTHELITRGPVVTKRFVTWARNEHRREWFTLVHLQRHAPGLAPEPVVADLEARPPEVVMTVIPGEPLHGALGEEELAGFATALQTLWTVPTEALAPDFAWTDDLRYARLLSNRPCPAEEVLARAHQEAVRWWKGPDPARLRLPSPSPVLGQRDANLDNFLWDGSRIRIVDFEDAAVVDPADELGLILEHLSTRQLDPDRLLTQFSVDPDRLLAARRVWAMFWLHLLLPGGSAEARNPPGTAARQASRLLRLLEV